MEFLTDAEVETLRGMDLERLMTKDDIWEDDLSDIPDSDLEDWEEDEIATYDSGVEEFDPDE